MAGHAAAASRSARCVAPRRCVVTRAAAAAQPSPLRKLGSSDLNVHRVCLGTMTWGKQNTEAEAHEQLSYAVEQRGINFIDTAGASSRQQAAHPRPSEYLQPGRAHWQTRLPAAA